MSRFLAYPSKDWTKKVDKGNRIWGELTNGQIDINSTYK